MKKQLVIGLISMLSATCCFSDDDGSGSVQNTSVVVVPGVPKAESIMTLIHDGTPKQ